MSKNLVLTVDVEKDLHSNTYKGVTEGLKNLEGICGRKTKPILFVTADCIKKHPQIFKKLANKGWEISLHGLTHSRFDELSDSEKEFEIKESIKIFRKFLGISPKGFRAPQHSIDEKTLDLLQKYNFDYDSSYTPLNLLQFVFFPSKIALNTKLFFSPINKYYIRSKLKERPCSSILIPFVSLTIRILPVWMSQAYVTLIKSLYREPIFYAHSWDFIKQPESKIDMLFSHQSLLTKLEKLIQ
jgi:hypothetical protein